jgi:hypothetical protein
VANPERSSSDKYTTEFTGLIEPGDYGPDDIELVSGRYVPRGHTACVTADESR